MAGRTPPGGHFVYSVIMTERRMGDLRAMLVGVTTRRRRPDYSESVVKTLFALSRNVCAFVDLDIRSGCEVKLTDPRWDRVNARIAHIHGLLPGSARYDPSYPRPMAFENLLLVCPNHHTVIDDLEPRRYTVEVLQEMKENSLSRADAAHPWADDAILDQLAHRVIQQMRLHWTATALAQEEEIRQMLAGAINRLGEREKIVLTLYHYERLTNAQISKVLGVAPSTASRIHRRALSQLRENAGLPDDWSFPPIE